MAVSCTPIDTTLLLNYTYQWDTSKAASLRFKELRSQAIQNSHWLIQMEIGLETAQSPPVLPLEL